MSKEFKVGLIALISGVVLYLGFNFLKGVDFLSASNKYYAVYDNVDGLQKSNPVIINGYAIGRVSKIKLLESNLILVELDIQEDLALGDSTKAILGNTDFLGSKGIVLDVGPLNNLIEPGDTLIPVVDKGLGELLNSVDPVATNLNTTITRINEILIGLKGSGEKINETIDEVKEMTIQVNGIIGENRYRMANIMDNTAKTVSSLNERLADLEPVLKKTEGALDSVNNLELSQTLQSVQATIDNLNGTITKLTDENGTVGKLVSNDELYQKLDATMTNLNDLINHINYYPKHFFGPLGKKHEKVMKELDKD